MSSLADQEDAVQDFMNILNEHRRNCEKLGRYVEAEIARKRIEELRQHEEARRREALRSKQLAEVLAVEEGHMMEFQQFNSLQDTKMASFEINAQALMDALRERHAAELRDFQQRLLAKVGPPRHSKEYYTLRDVQEKLAHDKNYAGAAKLKEKADELMAYEEEKWSNEKQKEMIGKESIFKQKLAIEAEALKKRIAQSRGEVNRTRQTELEKLLQRYNNVKTEMETRHRLERQKLEKEILLENKLTANNGNSSSNTGSGRVSSSSASITSSSKGSINKQQNNSLLTNRSNASRGSNNGSYRQHSTTHQNTGQAIISIHPMHGKGSNENHYPSNNASQGARQGLGRF